MEKSRKLTEQMQADAERAQAEREAEQQKAADPAAGQEEAGRGRQVEILGQVFDADAMAQMADAQALLEKAVDEKVAAATALGVEGMMDQLFGEDMGILSAALETLALEEEDDEDEEEGGLDQPREQELYRILEEKLDQIGALPEPGADPLRQGRPPLGPVRHFTLRHHLHAERSQPGRYGGGGAHPGHGAADRLRGAPLLGHQRQGRAAGHHPFSDRAGLCAALPALL